MSRGSQQMRQRRAAILAVLVLLVPLLACGGLAAVPQRDVTPVTVSGKPRWDCPTPSPVLETVEIPGPDLTPTIDVIEHPTATPYYRGSSFFLGQDVYSSPLRITVWGVRSAGPADVPGGGAVQLVDLEIASGVALPLDLSAQVVIREVQRAADGSGPRGYWRSDSETQARYGDPLPTSLQPATSWRGRVAIRTPEGTATMLYVYRTSEEARITSDITDGLLVFDLRSDPFCLANVARELPGGGSPGGIGGTPIAIPPGQNALVAYAVAHLGYPYSFGAKGPHAFDCSGLTYSAYKSIGISIPMGTTGGPAPGQGGSGTQISTRDLRPGDLLFFHTVAGPPPTHVGMYVGDLDGDGRGDMIHAGSPATGVQFVSNVLGASFYVNTFWGARRMPGFPW